MKLTKQRLKKIIKEEIQRLNEKKFGGFRENYKLVKKEYDTCIKLEKESDKAANALAAKMKKLDIGDEQSIQGWYGRTSKDWLKYLKMYISDD